LDARDRAAAQLLTAEEVAAQFNINVKTVRKWQQRGKVWAVKKGRDWLFWRGDWEQRAGGEDGASDPPPHAQTSS